VSRALSIPLTKNGSFLNARHDTLRRMNFRPTSRPRSFIGFAGLSLFVGWAVTAQQPGGDKPNEEIATAIRAGEGSPPTCKYCPSPEYSKEARKKKYEGVVVLFVVVSTEGKATNIQVVKSQGLGLDEKAVEAVRKWRFKPATFQGKPVPMKVPVEITFRLPN
jgi:TonB family protein